jgi:hypothetical protein
VALEHDEIGIWSEVKLAIIKEYASTYTKIMDAQRRERIPSLRWFYIDGYAGSGHHVSKTRGDLVEGSPLIALNTTPPFHEYHFIDSDTGRAAELRKEAGDCPDVFTYSEDCNTVLLSKVFPSGLRSVQAGAVSARPLQHRSHVGSDRNSGKGAIRRDFHELHDHGRQPQCLA